MYDVLDDLRRVAVLARTGVDPRRFRFVYHPDSELAVKDSLRSLGVLDSELDLFKLHESEAVDLGVVLVMDEEKLRSPLPLVGIGSGPADPVEVRLRDETTRLLSEHVKSVIAEMKRSD